MGDERELSMSLPLDEDGFLRRECPTCEREFKWLHSESEDDVAEVDNAGYFCPYCAVQAPSNAWWTPAQLERMQAIAAQEILGPELKKLGKSIERLNRPGGLISASFESDLPEVPDSNAEDNSGRRMRSRLHYYASSAQLSVRTRQVADRKRVGLVFQFAQRNFTHQMR